MIERNDNRPEIWLCGDESGTFDFRGRTDDCYFLVVTVGIRDEGLIDELNELAHQIGASTCDIGLPSPFHARTDSRWIKNRVFPLLGMHNLMIDATIANKPRLPATLRRRHELNQTFYTLMWYHHLIHVLPGILHPANKVHLRLAELGDRSKSNSFGYAYSMATAAAYIPLLQRAMGGDLLNLSADLLKTPALEFGLSNPELDRRIQVADYCAWAIHRKLERGEDRYYRHLLPHIRSERILTVRDAPSARDPNEPVIVGQMSMKGVRGDHHKYWVIPGYRRGPADSFQALISMQQAIQARRPSLALDMLEQISFADVFDDRFAHFVSLIAVLQAVVENDAELALRASGVLVRAASYLVTLSDSAPALPAVRQLILLTMRSMTGLVGKADAVGRTADAGITLCDHVLRHIPDDRMAHGCRASIMYDRALHTAKADAGEALTRYDAVIDRYGESLVPEARGIVAMALVNKGNLLRGRGLPSEALHCYRQAMHQGAHVDGREGVEAVIRAHLRTGELLCRAGRFDAVTNLLYDVQPWMDRCADLSVQQDVARSWQRQARILSDASRDTEAMFFLDYIHEHFSGIEDAEILEIWVRASARRLDLMRKTSVDAENGLSTLVSQITRLDDRPELNLAITRAHMLGQELNLLCELGRVDEALQASLEVLEACERVPREAVDITAANAALQRGRLFLLRNRFEEAIKCFDEVPGLCVTSDALRPGLQAFATLGKAHAYGKQGKIDKARRCLEQVNRDYSSSVEDSARQAAAAARETLDQIGADS